MRRWRRASPCSTWRRATATARPSWWWARPFGGRLPSGVRVTSKCNLGNAPPERIESLLRQSIETSLKRLRLPQLDMFFLHSNVVPDEGFIARAGREAAGRMTPYAVFVDRVRPLFERFVEEGLIDAWGLTGIGHPDMIIKLLGERPAPAAVQCIANLLDSPGGLKFFDGPAKPRTVIAAARANEVGVMGIRAVQAGALTSAIDRPLPADHAETRDYRIAAPFREICAELGANPAVVAHRYALSLDIDTLVLGREEPPGAGRVRGGGRSRPLAARPDRADRCRREGQAS